jgi:hypothetical protein
MGKIKIDSPPKSETREDADNKLSAADNVNEDTLPTVPKWVVIGPCSRVLSAKA